MSQYDFHSPGAAAGGALLDTLTRQRVEERQRLLDEVNKRNIESEISARAVNAASMDEERKGMKSWRDAQAKDITDRDAEHAAWKINLKNYMTTPEFAQLPKEAQQSLGIASMSGDPTLIKSTLDNLTTPKKDAHPMVPIWHKGRGGDMYDTGQEAPAGSIIANESEPQQPNAASQPTLYQTPDPANPGQFISYWLAPREQPSEKNRINVPMFKGNPPPQRTSMQRFQDMIPSDIRNAFSKQRQLLQAGKPNSFASSQDAAITGARNVHPDVKATVRDALRYGQDKTYEEIIAGHKGVFSDKINPTTGRSDASDFEDLLAYVKGS